MNFIATRIGDGRRIAHDLVVQSDPGSEINFSETQIPGFLARIGFYHQIERAIKAGAVVCKQTILTPQLPTGTFDEVSVNGTDIVYSYHRSNSNT